MWTPILQGVHYVVAPVSIQIVSNAQSNNLNLGLFFAYRTQKPNCPIDNQHLAEKDLFPDNYTRREIQQLRQPCTNSAAGCEAVVSPLDIDVHLALCAHAPPLTPQCNDSLAAAAADGNIRLVECTFKLCGCTYTAKDERQIDEHINTETAVHLNVSDFLCLRMLFWLAC